MRVCYIAQQSIRMVSGGPRTQVEQTARYLRESGLEVEFFDQWSEFPRERYDLVHLFGANMMTYDIAMRLSHFGVPFVVSSIFFSLHKPWEIRLARMAEDLLKKAFSGVWSDYGIASRVCRAARGVLPNTRDEGGIVERGFGVPSERIRVIPNGVEDRFADADPELFVRTYGVRDFILNVGHIGSHRKNVLSLIRALKTIDRPAVIIGRIHKGAYGDQCLKEAAENRNITIIDGLPNDSGMLASAYAACDTFVLPSYFETPGIAALEAGLAGAKIAITRYGGTREYFEGHADYIDPRSVSSIAQAIQSALARPRDGVLRQRIRDEYLWQRVAEKTAAAYGAFR